MANGYTGKITNAGTQVVQAPQSNKGKTGKTTVKTGNNLRTGKK